MFFHVVMLKPNSEQLVEIFISSRGLSQTFFIHSKMKANNATNLFHFILARRRRRF